MKRFWSLFLIMFLLWPLGLRAAVLKTGYPRLANYFLKWEITDQEAKELAQWDLLVLDMEVAENSRPQLLKIRQLNPQVIILAYLTAQEILDDVNDYNSAYLRQSLASQIIDGWYLKDKNGHKVSNWLYTSLLNLTDDASLDYRGQRFNDYLPEFIAEKIKGSGLWDGVFLDNIWGDISWVNNGNLDLNNDGRAESAAEIDRLWSAGVRKMLSKTRSLVGNDFLIVGNGRVYNGYQDLMNGMMLENFPSRWENGGTWTSSMTTYLNLPNLNRYPPTSIINALDKNQADYQHLRFGLTSALLGDGFFSFDYDITNHGQLWWYDEYSVNLGLAASRAYNLLANNSQTISDGLWRRDFKNGLVLVNTTNQEQRYIFNKEELEKIKGEQAPSINNGETVNYVKLVPQDGVVLLKKNTVIKESAFTNGYFFRVFSLNGQQTTNGFFSYLSAFPGEAELISTTLANGDSVNLVVANGHLSLYRNDQLVSDFKPYGPLFSGPLHIAAAAKDGYFRQIIVGPSAGGGPQVMIFTPDGRWRGTFFAYDKNSRGGVSVALGDVDGDGQNEIITAPGAGQEPMIKIFSLAGRLKTSFLAYGQDFKGGVNVTVGDLNGNGQDEIITGPGRGGGPQVRVFDAAGRVLGSFFAYDKSYHGGIKVTAADMNADGHEEILVGLKNFY